MSLSERNRKPNRLKGYDYSQARQYFVTICAQDSVHHFGRVENGAMNLNGVGEIVNERWRWLSERYDYIELDEYVVMPNHLHGILVIRPGGADRSRPVPTGKAKTKSLSELIGAFKTTSSKRIREGGLAFFQWQRSFHDHVIRDDEDLNRIREYIRENPARWALDEKNPENRMKG